MNMAGLNATLATYQDVKQNAFHPERQEAHYLRSWKGLAFFWDEVNSPEKMYVEEVDEVEKDALGWVPKWVPVDVLGLRDRQKTTEKSRQRMKDFYNDAAENEPKRYDPTYEEPTSTWQDDPDKYVEPQ